MAAIEFLSSRIEDVRVMDKLELQLSVLYHIRTFGSSATFMFLFLPSHKSEIAEITPFWIYTKHRESTETCLSTL